MKILQITSSFYPVIGGQEKVVLETSKELVKMGHDVTILTTDLFREDQKLPSNEEIEGINVVRLKNKFYLKGYGYSPGAVKWLKNNWKDYDLVHSHGYNRFLSEYALFYLRNKVPTFFSAHGFIHTKKNYFFKKIHDITLGKVVKYAKKCTALTKLDYAEYSKLGVPTDKVMDLPNGVDVDKYNSPDKKLVNSLKKKFNLKNKTLIYAGRIHKSKGLNYVFEAIQNLDCNFLIVGQDAGYKEDLIKLSKKLGIEDKIIFAGCLSDEEFIAAYYSSDIFVLFSEWEGFGIVAIEAMATALPVIVSDRGSLPFIVENGCEGYIVPFENVDFLKKKIDFLLCDPKKRKILGTNGKNKSKKYSWKNIVDGLEKVYTELTEK
jgi:glycosyltransferase involved in cell wall biosynthesis